MQATGALKSPTDVRNFAYMPRYTTAPQVVGKRWEKQDHRHQHKVGICTAMSLVQQANKAFGMEMSPEVQYHFQKKFVDGNWDEGSSALSALKVGTNIGFVPKIFVDKYITEEDRKIGYVHYIGKLKAIPDSVIEEWKGIASQYKLAGYYRIPLHWEALKNAIHESEYGIIARFVVDSQWWRGSIEPLRAPVDPISGHLITISKADGISYRVENEWGEEWADEGSAYGIFTQYKPTEAWLPVFPEHHLVEDIENKKEKKIKLIGQLLELLQKMITILSKR